MQEGECVGQPKVCLKLRSFCLILHMCMPNPLDVTLYRWYSRYSQRLQWREQGCTNVVRSDGLARILCE